MGLEANAADVLFNVANLTRSVGHRSLADQLLRESLALYTRQGNADGIARCEAGMEERPTTDDRRPLMADR